MSFATFKAVTTGLYPVGRSKPVREPLAQIGEAGKTMPATFVSRFSHAGGGATEHSSMSRRVRCKNSLGSLQSYPVSCDELHWLVMPCTCVRYPRYVLNNREARLTARLGAGLCRISRLAGMEMVSTASWPRKKRLLDPLRTKYNDMEVVVEWQKLAASVETLRRG